MRRRTILQGIGVLGALGATRAFAAGQIDRPPFAGNQPRPTQDLMGWYGTTARETAIEPAFPIVDPHHHLFNTASDKLYYRMEDLAADLSGGHRVLGTVYVEAYSAGWRKDGPEAYRSVGEVERIVGLTEQPLPMSWGSSHIAAGIVSSVDLAAGDDIAPVLAAHKEAGVGRLRGVRHHTAYDSGSVGSLNKHQPSPQLMAEPKFRQGMAQLQRAGLSFDAWVYHTQLADLADLAAAFPEVDVVVNHMGGLIGVAEHREQREAALKTWRQGLAELARHPNVKVKVGGMGMPVFGFGFEHAAKPASSDDLARAWAPLVEVCLETFGTGRCMFESNFPVDKQSAGYNEVWNAFKKLSASLSADERRDVFYRTACEVYRLPELRREGDAMAG
ncbi:amidohydrolase family protein [Verticiella sediminum]|uniref:amidohydrolase family protein n=1 Tax=Verticiella sediminum TaxID=1247510 RepID=UPI001478CD8E|nr:amidohydrolase family protein [Verticiella sediminum]